MKKIKKVKKKTTSQLKKELDKVFSEFIRRKYANKQGYTQCYTCPKILPWKEIQCGHFVSRTHLATRFREENVRPQCVGCNIFGGGKTAVFATRLNGESGGDIVSQLYREAQQIVKNFPYQEKIEYYKQKIQELG